MPRNRAPLLGLTIHQPYAWAISTGAKTVENRNWPPPAGTIGRYLAIHAGRQYDEVAALQLTEHWETLGLPSAPPGGGSIARGAIVAVAHLAGAVQVAEAEPGRLAVVRVLGDVVAHAPEAAASPWARGEWLWVLADVVAIEPVPCRGLQKLWTVPSNVADQVRERYAAARRAA
jgi:hypothetical protein